MLPPHLTPSWCGAYARPKKNSALETTNEQQHGENYELSLPQRSKQVHIMGTFWDRVQRCSHLQDRISGRKKNCGFDEPLGTMHPIYRTDVPLLPRVLFFIYSVKKVYLIFFFRISLTIFVYSPTKCRVFPKVTLLVNKIFTFYINVVLNCKCPAPGSKG